MPTRKSTSRDAGRSRRTRRAQNFATSVQLRGGDLMRWLVMRNPEMTKKTSTPTNPPTKRSGHKW
jgi:hypothetical protein